MKAMTAKPIHLRKLAAITEVKGKTLLSKNFIIMPVFSLGFTFLINMIYSRIMDGAAQRSIGNVPQHKFSSKSCVLWALGT